MRYLYSLLFYILSPLAVLRLLWRSRKAPLYRQRIAERFGYFKGPEMIGGIWVHTVWVGEFLAALPFIERLLLEYPDKPIVVTTTTPTGSAPGTWTMTPGLVLTVPSRSQVPGGTTPVTGPTSMVLTTLTVMKESGNTWMGFETSLSGTRMMLKPR